MLQPVISEGVISEGVISEGVISEGVISEGSRNSKYINNDINKFDLLRQVFQLLILGAVTTTMFKRVNVLMIECIESMNLNTFANIFYNSKCDTFRLLVSSRSNELFIHLKSCLK